MVPPKATRKSSENDRKINIAFIFSIFRIEVQSVCQNPNPLRKDQKKAPFPGARKCSNKDLYIIGDYTALFLSSNVSTKHAKRATDINASIFTIV